MRQTLLFFFLAVGALLAGLATGRDLWFTLAYLLAILLLVAFLWAWISLRTTVVGRLTRTLRTQVDQPFEERVYVENSSYMPKLWLEVQDFSELPQHHLSRVVSNLGIKKRFLWKTTTTMTQRGQYRLGPMHIRTSDPFGLFVLEKPIPATTQLLVLPYTLPLPTFQLPQGVISGGNAQRQRTLHQTTNAAGVRDYAPGDGFNRIHWPSTAKTGRLIVREFEIDPLTDIWIVPDLSADLQLGSAETSGGILPCHTIEYIITLAASLAQLFLDAGRPVGLWVVGAQQQATLLQPDLGVRQRAKVLETLAVVQSAEEGRLAHLLLDQMRFFERGSTLITISPTTDPEWIASARELQRRGVQLVHIALDPQSFGGVESAEPLHNHLKANNISSYWVRYGDDLATTLSRPS